ncbi:MAG TPA: hypothetical protein VG388_13275 [Solirubrobacteraceae bacterium]|nr:hypothetical protein [Solirubrobacteraceae bacterium]
MAGSVCVVTVHGIGFQQPPEDGRPGYADILHENLRRQLGDRLGDDPNRPAPGGPVYVRSEWKGSPADGLARLDKGKPLVSVEGRIAHVALVYSPSEPVDPRFGATAETLARAAISHAHYTSTLGALRLLLSDAWAALHEHSGGDTSSTLTPRTDEGAPVHHGLLTRILHPGAQAAAPSSSGAFGILRALEDDVATYVTRNDVRERVRGFVEDALLMLIDRGDITGVVINSHSQGTVLCWDVLCRLPFTSWVADGDPRAGRFRHFVTAGSPIRKYVDMFAWGDQVGELSAVLEPVGSLHWHNFCDPHDPVGDPLNPPTNWRPGDPWGEPPKPDDGLLVAREESGDVRHVSIDDTRVDNIRYSSGGGLQAHDYWNNEKEFIPALAALL